MAAGRREVMAAVVLAALPATARGEDRLVASGRRLAGLLSVPASAATIATAHLRGSRDWREALAVLGTGEGLDPALLAASDRRLRAALGTRIRADFAAGAVVDVDGWQLSRTEVACCLMVAGGA